MSKRVSTRPRRTRMYDANYNIGQSYYKPTLDQLDRKYYGRPENDVFSPKLRFNIDDTLDNELSSARSRASRAITEDSVFDSRGGRASRGIPLSSAFMNDDDLDEDVQASLSRIRANRPKISSLINDLDLDDSFSSTSSRIKRRMNLESDLADDEDFGGRSATRSRALKMISKAEEFDEPSVSSRSIVSSYKRSAVVASDDVANEGVSSAASMRAQVTKARLADIESEMSERTDKLLEREKRAANLKKMLAENDIEEVKSIKKVTF